MIVRMARKEEVGELKAMVKGIYPYPYEETADLWLLAEKEGEVLGCIGMERPNGGYPCLSPLAIRPAYQKKSVAGQLIKMAEGLYRLVNAPGYIFGIRKENTRMKEMCDRYATLYREDNGDLYYGVDFNAKQK